MGLELRFLGDFAVIRDGRTLALPPSRKTRALLAWLCLHKRRFRREQLCELLWEVPDDPRGSLRWSLSKLRRLLDDDARHRVVADRAGVEIDTRDMTIDVCELYALSRAGLPGASVEALETAAARFLGNFLEDIEFSGFHQFHAWCVAEREQSTRAQAAVLRELVKRLEKEPEHALPHARALANIAPYDEPSRAMLIRLLHRAQHVEEANEQYQLGIRMLKEAGVTSSGLLLSALRGGGAASHAPARTPPAESPPATPPAATGRHEQVGRESEERQLEAAMARVAGSTLAEVVVVIGEPGIGKSRMLEYVACLARDADACLLQATAFESEAMRPFALWLDALRCLGSGAEKRVFGGDGVENRERLFADLTELVAGEAATRPVVLIFDDAHWCDESSAAALHYVTRTNRDRPLLVVLAARDGDLQENVPLEQALRGLRSAGLLCELKLAPLWDEAIARLIALRSPGADRGRLSRRCGGNPLLAIELARAENDGAGTASVDQLVRERLAHFEANVAEVLRWAAVLNPRLDVPLLARLTSLGPDEVAVALEHAERQAILSWTDRGLAFSHELVARAVYTDISPVRRQVMHRRVAELMEEDAALDLGQAADLAHHATQSGDPGLAAKAMVSAGRLCLRFFANDEALSLARKGLQLADQLPAAERVCLHIDLHGILLSAAPLEDWEAAARQYVALAEEALDHGALAHARRGYNMAAWLRWEHGHWAGAREQSLQSERVARGGTDKQHIIGLAETAKCLVMLERDLSQADAMLMEAESRAARTRFRHRSITAGRGMLKFYENSLDEAEELLKEARTLCKRDGDRLSEYQANEYLVMIAIQRGLFAEARSRCRELLELGRKLREGSEAPFAASLDALCGYAMGDHSGPLDAALQELRIADAKHRLAYVLTRAALLDCERGRMDVALARATEALGYAELLERGTEMMLAHAALALGHRASGQITEAEQHLAAVTALQAAGVAEWAKGMVAEWGRTEVLSSAVQPGGAF